MARIINPATGIISGTGDYSPGATEDKHWGHYLASINIGGEMAWWVRFTKNGSTDFRENTSAVAHVKQYQEMRNEAPSFDAEFMVPALNSDAQTYLMRLKEGTVISSLACKLFPSAYFLGTGGVGLFGDFFIERSNVDASRDDFTMIRITLRAKGYGSTTTYPTTGDGTAGDEQYPY